MILSRVKNYLPVRAFHFDRPLVIFQSDDWGMCGVPDRAGFDALCRAGVKLGAYPYDFHSLETANDLYALYAILARHRDAVGRAPSFVFNFIVTNVNCAYARARGLDDGALLPLDVGLPGAWQRSGLWDAYRAGIREGFIYPGFHGLTHFHFCTAARALREQNERGARLRMLYQHDMALSYSQAPWLAFEYKEDSGASDAGWMDADTQRSVIGRGVAHFQRMFGTAPFTACAPGYHANADTRRAWFESGVRIAQNGPGTGLAPHTDAMGLLRLYRNVALEPALAPALYTVTSALTQARRALGRGRPAVVCMHAVNFHSTIRNFRDETLRRLDEFLTRLEREFPNLLYIHDGELWNLVRRGVYEWRGQPAAVKTNTFWQPAPALAQRLAR